MPETDTSTFTLFHTVLLKGAPQGYTPWFIALEPNGKDPLKGFSWAKNPLTYEEAVKRLEKGGNVGIAAKTEDHLVIVDIDDLTATDIKTVKETLTAKSRKRLGIHLFYFKAEGAEISNIPTDRQGEVRANNQYVVAPGSYVPVSKEELARIPEGDRENAGKYTLELARPPAMITLEELPEVFLAQLAKGETAYRQGQKEPFKPHPNLSPLYNLTFKDILPGVVEGQRIPHPFHDSETGHNFVITGGLAHCWRHNVSLNPVQLLAVKYGLLSCLDAGTGHSNSGAGPSKVTPEILEKIWGRTVEEKIIKRGSRPPRGVRQSEQILDEDEKFTPMAYGEAIMKNSKFLTFRDTGEIYVYLVGIYAPYGETVIEELAQELLAVHGIDIKNQKVTEILGYIRRATYRDRAGIEAPIQLICLKNGIYDLNINKLTAHTPNLTFFTQLPVQYDMGATCPTITKFLNDVMAPEDIEIFLEFLGSCLERHYQHQKALILVGGGGNGKGVTLGIARALLGQDNCSAATLQDIVFGRFTKAELYSKLANICGDLPNKKVGNTGIFKMLTGGDMVSAEKKGKHPFKFINYAKLIFSANEIPEADDDTDAFFDRWIIIEFPNRFRGTDKEDQNILVELTTPAELSGLLNLVLDRACRRRDRGRFSHSMTTEKTREIMIRKSSPEKAFLMDCVSPDPNGTEPKAELYNYYKQYCEKNNLSVAAQNKFSEKVLSIPGVKTAKLGETGKRYWAYRGLKFKKNDGDYEECPGNVQVVLGQPGHRGQLPGHYPKNGGLGDQVDQVKRPYPSQVGVHKYGGSVCENSKEGRLEGGVVVDNIRVGQINMVDMDIGTDQFQQSFTKLPLKTIIFQWSYEAFVGMDGCTYGPFVSQDIASLPEENARVIIAQGAALAADFPVEPEEPNNGHDRPQTAQHTRLIAILDLIKGLEREYGTAKKAEILATAQKNGIPKPEAEKAIEKLKLDGYVFEPKNETYKST